MTTYRPHVLILALILLSTYLSFGSFPAKAFAEDKTIVMFIPDTDWPPYLIDDPKFPGGGVLVDVLTAVAAPLGYTVETKRLPNKRGWMMLDKGEVDVHAKAKEWVKHPDMYLWTEPFMVNEDVMIYPANKPLHYTTPEKLYGKTVAAMDGFVYPALEPHFASYKITRRGVASPFAMLELVARERVDAALVNRSETQWLFRNRPDLGPERFVMDETPFDSAGYRYAFTKEGDWQPFIDAFNASLEEMKKNGKLQEILSKYN